MLCSRQLAAAAAAAALLGSEEEEGGGKKEKYFGVVTFHTAEDDAKELLHFPQMNKVSH